MLYELYIEYIYVLFSLLKYFHIIYLRIVGVQLLLRLKKKKRRFK